MRGTSEADILFRRRILAGLSGQPQSSASHNANDGGRSRRTTADSELVVSHHFIGTLLSPLITVASEGRRHRHAAHALQAQITWGALEQKTVRGVAVSIG